MTRPGPPAAPAARAPRIFGSLILGVAALILGLMATLPWLAHGRAEAWPVVTAEVLARTVLTQHVNRKGPS